MAKQVSGLLEKVRLSFEILKQNGGPVGRFEFNWIPKRFFCFILPLGSVYQLFRTDALKSGTVVGVDKVGNTYYENKRYFVGRSRWVVYNDNVSFDYDGSQVPAEWYGWLHYKTDVPPTIVSRSTLYMISSWLHQFFNFRNHVWTTRGWLNTLKT